MKTSLLSLLLCLSAGLASAQTTFPGLKAILTAAEWQRAGLDRLTPDEIGVIDAALIRQQAGTTAQLQGELTKARAAATAPTTAQLNPSLMQRFGLPLFDDGDWRTMPPLRARFAKWEGGNRFRLDNGQVWEGSEPITYDLAGKDLEIQARPHGQFALVVDGVNTTLRVIRLR
ncbi:MAG: hypothetical protein KA788_02790 [Lacunisphaera sp.]|jgi:hypothetical protein|nr:hypothetical protein [Lacunisphaera sp.]